MSIFLTGTDTGVGKTHIAVELLRLLCGQGIRAVGMKPICCGDRNDAAKLLAASAGGASIDEINPIWLKAPVAPSVAAAIEKIEIDSRVLEQSFEALQSHFDVVIVEGVGGWLVPLTPTEFVADLAAIFRLPIVIVAANRLGCLNHIFLTVESVRRRHLPLAGIVLNEMSERTELAESTNESEIRRVTGLPILPIPGSRMQVLGPEWGTILGDKSVNKT